MLFLYGLIIRSYFLCIQFAALFHWKARLFVKYRQNWLALLKEALQVERPRILIICPSIGEFQECKTFLTRYTSIKSGHQFVYAFFSPSGHDQAKIKGVGQIRMMLPADTSKNMNQLLDEIQPQEVFILVSGIWPQLMKAIQQRGIPHYLISFYGRASSSFYKPVLKTFYCPFFKAFSNIFCYNENSKTLLEQHFQYQRAVIVGNLRFDCVQEMKHGLREIPGIREFVSNRFCFVAGSTEKREDEILAKTFRKLQHLDMRWIIVPHEKLPGVLNKLMRSFGEQSSFYKKNFDPGKKVLIYDVTGDLFQLYQYCQLSLVGRGFEKLEIHNMLEPTVFLKPTLFGPKHKKFVEPCLFVEHNLSFVFRNENELAQLIERAFFGQLNVETEAIAAVFNQYSGGTDIVINTLQEKDRVMTSATRV